MENLYPILWITIPSVLFAFYFCYLYVQNKKLKEKKGQVLDEDDLKDYYKKGVYLKLVTIISKAQFGFEAEKKVEVYGFEIGTLTLEKFQIKKEEEEDPVREKIFFNFSSRNPFPNFKPLENYIYKVEKMEGAYNGKDQYKLIIEKYLKNVPNAGQKAS